MLDISTESCKTLRKDILTMLHASGSGHAGGSLSCVEIMDALYGGILRIDPQNPKKPDRDYFVLSKGHAAPALYAALAERGFFPKEELLTLRKAGSHLQGHPDKNKVPGVDMTTGSLGQGISIATGLALGTRTKGYDSKIYVLTGDGELQEGLCWEAAMAAANYKLSNLTLIVDWNGLQIDGPNEEVMNLGDLGAKFRAFGFEVCEIDGNDLDQVVRALSAPAGDKPRCVLAHTVKGKGVSFYENQVGSHGAVPNDEQYEQAMVEIG